MDGNTKILKINLYWSKDLAYAQSLHSSILSRNRFKLALHILHFCDNENKNLNDPIQAKLFVPININYSITDKA